MACARCVRVILQTWCIVWLLCLWQTRKHASVAESVQSRVPLDFSASNVRLRVSRNRTFLSRKVTQALLDGDNNTCVVATPRDFRESAVIIRVDLGNQCLDNIIAHVVMANASSLYPTLYLRQLCLTSTQTKACEMIRHDSRRSAVYECSDDPGRLVTIVVPANQSICEIAMSYVVARDLPKFSPLTTNRTVDLTKSIQDYQIGETVRVVVGQTLHLRCAAFAPRNPTYKWQLFPEGRHVTTTENITVEGDALTITNMQKEQENIYSCTVTNRLGTITKSSLVKVYGFAGWTCDIPKVLEKTKRSLVLSLSCLSGNASDPYGCHITNYAVLYRAANDNSEFLPVTAKSPLLNLTDLIPNTMYEITVKANYSHSYCDNNNISSSPSLFERLHAEVPSAPTGVRVTSRTATSAKVEWNATVYTYGSVVAYRVYSAAISTAFVSTNLTFVWLDGLKPYTEYAVNVSVVVRPQHAVDSSKDLESEKSVEYSFAPRQSYPSSPIDVQVVNRTDVSVKVVWKTPVTPNGQIAYYKVSYIMGNHSHGTNVSDLRTSNVTGTREDILQNLKPFTVYTVWVQAVNIEGINHLVGNKSVEKTFQTLKADFLEFHPLVSHTTVNFTKPIQQYQVGEMARLVVGQTLVLRCNASGSPSPAYQWSVLTEGLTVTKADNVVIEGNTLTITNVQAQNDNEYQCTASNQFGNITNSSLVKVYESVDQPCEIPRELNKTDRSLSLELSCPPGHTATDYDCNITQYSVRYRMANTDSDFSAQTVPSPMLTISNLIPYTVYEINAQAQYQHSYCTSKNVSFSPSLTTRLKPEDPTAPKRIHVPFRTARAAKVAWNSIVYTNGSVVAYKVYYRASPPQFSLTNSTSIMLDGLKPFTRYSVNVVVVVKPRNASNSSEYLESPRSNDYSFMTRQSKPSRPRNVKVVNRTALSAKIVWEIPFTPNGPIAYYDVSYGMGHHPNDTRVSNSTTSQVYNTTEAVIPNLKPFTVYTVWIQAVNIEGNKSLVGNATPGKTFETLQTEPSNPRNVKVVNRTALSVKIVWKIPFTPNGQIAYYDVSYGMGDLSNDTRVSNLKTFQIYNTTEAILQTLKPFTVYTVWVQAVNIEGINHLVGNKSVEKTFQTLKADFLEFHPLVSHTTVNFTKPIQQYQVGEMARLVVGQTLVLHCNASGSPSPAYQWSVLTEGLTVTKADNVVIEGNTLTITNVQAQNDNEYQCTANNQFGNITNSSLVKVYESVDKPCAIPRLLNKTDRSLSLELSCPPGHTAADYDCSITQYSVRYRIANINSEFSTQTVPSPMLTISNLIPYTVYEINAQAQYQHSYCTSKNASFSPSLTTRLKPEDPTAPKRIHVPFRTARAAKVAWNSIVYTNGSVVAYKVYYRASPHQFSLTNSTSIMLDGLKPFTRYSVNVVVVVKPRNASNSSEYLESPRSNDYSFMTRQSKPSRPRNEKVVNRTALSAKIVWEIPFTPNGPIAYYDVSYGMGHHPNDTRVSNSTTSQVYNTTEAVIPNLKPFTVYTVWIQAVNIEGNKSLVGNATPGKTFETLQTEPSNPRNVKVVNRTALSVKIVWKIPFTPNGQIAYYNVSYGMGDLSNDTRVSNLKTFQIYNTTKAILQTLKPFTVYTVWVQAVNVEGNNSLVGDASARKTFVTLKAAPTPPQHLQVSQIQTDSFRLTWQPPAHPNGLITYYEIMIAEGNISNPSYYKGKANSTVTGNSTTYTIGGLMQLSQYSVWIKAVNIKNSQFLRSDPSLVEVVQTIGENLETSPPHSLHSIVTNDSATLTWQPPLNPSMPITSYTVKLFNSRQMIQEMIANNTNVSFNNLLPFTQYRVTITPIVYDVSTSSASLNFTTKQNTLSPPINLETQAVQSTNATISWSPPPQAKSNNITLQYKVFAQTRNDSLPSQDSKNTTTTTETSKTRVTLHRLIPYTTYYVWVAAIRDDGKDYELMSHFVGPINFTTLAKASSPPQNVHYSNVTATSVFVMWSKPKHVYGKISVYEVTLTSSDLSSQSKVVNVKAESSPDQSTTMTGLKPCTKYYIDISAGTRHTSSKSSVILYSDSKVVHAQVNFITDCPDFLKFHPLVSHTTVNFTKPVQHYQVGETARLVVGQTLVLHCNVSGSPSPTYQWSVPRKGLTVTKADNVVRDGNTLTITNVQAQNDNEYQCTASNQFGKITNSSLVTVYESVDEPCAIPRELNKTDRSLSLELSCPPGRTAADYDCSITQYSVRYRIANTNSEFSTENVLLPMFTISNLIPYTEYEINAQAQYKHSYCTSKNVSFSPSLTTRLKPEDPRAPIGINVPFWTARAARVAWNSTLYTNGSVVAYKVYTTSHAKLLKTNFTSIMLDGLKPFTRYSVNVVVVVKPRNASQTSEYLESPRSNDYSFMTRQSKPSRPRNVKVVHRTALSVKIVWEIPSRPNGPIAYYDVSYVMGDHFIDTRVSNSTTIQLDNTTEAIIQNLKPFTVYMIWVQAVNVEGNKSLVGNTTAGKTFVTLQAAPTPPQHLQVSQIQTDSFRLTWQPPVHPNGLITYYEIMIAEGNVSDPAYYKGKANSTVTGNSTTYTVGGLTQLSQYSVWIKAVNIKNSQFLRSDPSLVEVVQTIGESKHLETGPPHSLHSIVTNDSATLTWQPPLNPSMPITSYTVELFNSRQMIQETIANNTNVSFNNLLPFTQYRVTITPIVYDVWTSSASLNFTTKQNTLSPPINLETQAVQSTNATISWSPPPQAKSNNITLHYKVFAQTRNDSLPSQDSKNTTTTTETSKTRVTLHRLIPYSTYYVWVAAIRDDGKDYELMSHFVGPINFTTLAKASSPPQNVHYSNVTATSVFVTWSKPKHVYGEISVYQVTLTSSDLLSQSKVVNVKAESSPDQSTTMTGLKPCTKYYIDISAGTRHTSSKSSVILYSDSNKVHAQVNFITDCPDFLKFHPLVSHTTVNFTKPVQHYQVGETARLVVGQTLVLHCNVSGSPSPAYQWSVPRKGLTVTKADNVVRDGNTLTITNVQAQNDNEYQCTASNQFGKITNSSLVTVYESVDEPCAIPRELNKTDRSLSLELSCPPGRTAADYDCSITQYSVRYRIANTNSEFSTENVLLPMFTISNLIPYTEYEINAQAQYKHSYCTSKNVSFSPSLTTRLKPEDPRAPIGINVPFWTARAARVAWNSTLYTNGSVVAYKVYTTSHAKLLKTNFTSIMLDGLKPFTRYSVNVVVVVKPRNASQTSEYLESPRSNDYSFMTRQSKPSRPRNVKVVHRTALSVKIVWEIPSRPNGPIAYYDVSYVMGDHFIDTRVSNSTTIQLDNTTEAIIQNLKPFTVYMIWVQAVNVEGNKSLVGNTTAGKTFVTLQAAPTPPQHLQVSQIQTDSFRLTWQPPVHPNGLITYYEIMIAEGNVSDPAYYKGKANSTVTGNSTTYTVGGLTQLSQYSVWIKAVNIKNSQFLRSDPSLVEVVQTIGESKHLETSPPHSLHSIVTNDSATLTWQPPLNPSMPITSYTVELFNSRQMIQETIANNTNVSFNNLLPFTQYRVTITPIVYDVWTSSASLNFTTKQNTLSPPINLETQAVQSTNATISWSPPPQAKSNNITLHYKVFAQTRNDSLPSQDSKNTTTTTETSKTRVTLHRLIPYSIYYVWVAAIRDDGKDYELMSHFVGPINFTTLAKASSPPQNVHYSNVTATSVFVMWSKPKHVYGEISVYQVTLTSSDLSSQIKVVNVNTESSPNQSTTMTGLKPYTKYYIEISAGTRHTSSKSIDILYSDSNVVDAQVTFITDCPAPSPPTLLNASTVRSHSALIHWKPPEKMNGKIQFFYNLTLFKKDSNATNGEGWMLIRNHRIDSSTQYKQLHNLSPHTWYNVSVSAVNVCDKLELKSTMTSTTFLTDDEEPTAPSNCDIHEIDDTFVSLSWNPATRSDFKVAYYEVDIRTEEPNHQLQKVYSHHFNVTGLHPSTTYYITITAVMNSKNISTEELCNFQVQPRAKDNTLNPIRLVLFVNTTENEKMVVIAVPSSNKPNNTIKSVQVTIIELKAGFSWSKGMPLPESGDVRVSQMYNMSLDMSGSHFTMANNDSQLPMLKPNTSYIIYFRWTSSEDAETVFISASQINKFSTDVGNDQLIIRHQPPSTSRPRQHSPPPSSLLLSSSSTSSPPTSSLSSPLLPTPTPRSRTSTLLAGGNLNLVAIIVSIIIISTILVIILIWLICCRGKRKSVTLYKGRSENLSQEVTLKEIRPSNESVEPSTFVSFVMNNNWETEQSTSIIEFERHVKRLKACDNEGFAAEFDELNSVGTYQSTSIARRPENAMKNRYRNVVPYDDGRVMLHDVDGMHALENDYINATYINGYTKRKKYIVTQGPLFETSVDFWRMVWLEGAEFIVMVTRAVESGKEKCFQYWSDSTPKYFGGLTVAVETVSEMADYTMRTMTLKLRDAERLVTHYQFKSWPDHGVPSSATNLLGLIYHYRRDSRGSTAPLIIHCSAGVGRSGTLVAIDTLMNVLAAGGDIDVKSVVVRLRMSRTNMVQSMMQYIFIHDAVLEAYHTRRTEITASKFSSKTESLMCLDVSGFKKFKREFDVLLKLSPPCSTTPIETTVLQERNRDLDFVPPETSRVLLFPSSLCDSAVAKGADYINASFVDGYHKRNFFIVTQAPLPSTITNMWNMVSHQNVSAIVNLAQEDEFDQYWPDSVSQTYRDVSVDVLSSEIQQSFAVHRVLVNRGQSSNDVSLFHYTAWPNNSHPKDMAGLLDLMNRLDQWMKTTGGNRVVVHCCSGVGRTGSFCAAYNVIDQLNSEGVANVLHVTKILYNQRPRIIQTPEDYETVYTIVDNYQQSDKPYYTIPDKTYGTNL
ncbi:uncharacterized protein LOC134186081 isoform X2 [Corticium candelabrum]|uniref:uncharacterized protein LOC134186081 isoform X2 n=1 Tax=Corticium candelabrum TaxID=121492 RepID=UPI002E25A2AF|nr:uncharacterized protein LOC134186081 isoform X2 [Corticium candelabrum]